MKISGVYKITNTITGDFYIGSSKDIKSRWANHKSPSTWVKRPGMKLYQVFAKYGLANFTFEVIEETSDIYKREQYWIEQLKPNYNSNKAFCSIAERQAQLKEWRDSHLEYRLVQMNEWEKVHYTERQAYRKKRYSRLCFYYGETLTFSALINRLQKQGIPHATLEAKKYLLEN